MEAEAPVVLRASDPLDWSEADRSWALAHGFIVRVPSPELAEEQPVGLPVARDGEGARRAEPEPVYIRNQLCWCCEERRSCRVDPSFITEVRMICRTCEQIDPQASDPPPPGGGDA